MKKCEEKKRNETKTKKRREKEKRKKEDTTQLTYLIKQIPWAKRHLPFFFFTVPLLAHVSIGQSDGEEGSVGSL